MASYTGQELAEIISQQSKNSIKISIGELVNIYRDNWNDIIEAALYEQFSYDEFKKTRLLITKKFNLIKRVIKEISLVYKNPAKREAIIKSKEEILEKNTDNNIEIENITDKVYEREINKSSINYVMPEVNKYTNLTNHVLVKPTWRDDKLDYDIILFDNAEIIEDPRDWKKIIAVKYYVGIDLPSSYDKYITEDTVKINTQRKITDYQTPIHDFTKAYLYTLENYDDTSEQYTKGMIYVFEKTKNGEKIIDSYESNYKNKNGFPVLPFVLTYLNYPVTTLLNFTAGNDLRDANIDTALNMIHLKNLIKYQSYKQIIFSGTDPDGLPEKIYGGPSTAIRLWDRNGNATASLLDLQTNIENLWRVIKEDIALVLAQYNIKPSNFELSAQPESGFSAMMSNYDKLEFRQSQISYYRDFENQLFELTKIIYNADSGKPDRMNINSKLSIDFAEIEFPMRADEKMKNIEFEKQHNLITDIDIIKDKNPDLTDDEAMKKYNENKAINQREKVAVQSIQQPGQKGVNNAIEKR